jgi:hypothetical protein
MPKWTVVIDGREYPARPLILTAAGVAPNDATNSHMAIAKLKALGFETRYAGQEHSGPAPELVTTYEGKELAHRECWEVVLEHQALANSRDRGWYRPSLVAMMFAFHAVEAYLNFVGELLAPDIWKNEREYFKKMPYRGFHGKLRKVAELVGLTADESARPLKTVLELKTLRDLIAHGRSEAFEGAIAHGRDEESPYPVSTLRSKVLPRTRLGLIVTDVEAFLNSVHALAAEKLRAGGKNDPWFGGEALRGPSWYASRHTTLVGVDD